MDAEMSPIDVAAMLRGLGDFYEPVADEAGLTLVAEIGGGSLNVLGNRHLLSRAVANLIDNAVKYTPSPGRIEIRAVREESAVRIEVSDSGPGIPAESHGQVFERFVRLENSRTSPGNGLGLSLVRAIISLHGGSISLENNDPGLRVIISIPLGGPPATLGDHRSGSAAKTHSLTSMNAMAPILCQKAP
jgi:signal transduction histidine kinase